MPQVLRSIVGRRLGLSSKGHLVSDGRILAAHPRNPMALINWQDDFLGDVLADQWAVAKGSDGACVDFATSADVRGMVRATTGAGAGASMAANGVQLHSYLNWKANQGGLAISGALKMSAITTIAVFIGLTDQIAALEMPIHSAGSANTITTNATDAVGFFFDTSQADDYWWCAGVANDVDGTHVSTAIAPTADTYQRFRIELDTSGNATFFLNEARVGYVASAVTATVALTPVVAAFRRAASSATVDVDYLCIEAER